MAVKDKSALDTFDLSF